MGSVLKFVPLLASLLSAAPACAVAAADGLYEVRTIVTGQGEETRPAAFATALEAVLVKVSGDQQLIDDPRVGEEAGDAASFVESFSYRDRLAGIPVRDEQGTRDRPYDLTVPFRPDRIDALLSSLGRDPWPAPRPRVAVFVRVEHGAAQYVLASDGELGRDQREALAAAADGVGVPLAVPSEAALTKAGMDAEAINVADAARLDAAARAVGGDRGLAGELVWSEQDLVWVASWRLASGGKTLGWRVAVVSFDEAFRNAMRGTAGILSDRGEPQ